MGVSSRVGVLATTSNRHKQACFKPNPMIPGVFLGPHSIK